MQLAEKKRQPHTLPTHRIQLRQGIVSSFWIHGKQHAITKYQHQRTASLSIPQGDVSY